MVDLFHAQLIRGNLSNALKDMKNYIGHVQIAQPPKRHEPDTAGEMDCKYILKELFETNAYTDWVGLEYVPLNDTVSGLKWITDFGYEL